MKLKTAMQGLGLLAALALDGCAKAPTEMIVTVQTDPAVTLPITSMAVSVTGAAEQYLGGGKFISLATPPADAEVAAFYFPAQLQITLASDSPAGDVSILIEGSDPTTDGVVTARGVGTGTVTPQATTQGTVTLLAVAPPVPDGGVPDASDDAEPDAAVTP
jgi:hypothetical protein